MRKEYKIKDHNNNLLVTFYYDGNDVEKISKIKRYLYNLTNYVLQIIAMNYKDEEDDDKIYGYVEVLIEEFEYILHQGTLNAISDSYDYPEFIKDKIYLLRETIGPMLNDSLEDKMKRNDSEWIKVSEMAQEILEALGINQVAPSVFEKNENLSMDWI